MSPILKTLEHISYVIEGKRGQIYKSVPVSGSPFQWHKPVIACIVRRTAGDRRITEAGGSAVYGQLSEICPFECNYDVVIMEPMDGLRFSWDARKAAANLKKHGVSFEEAKTIFSDEYARLIRDPEHSDEEDRYILLGYSIRLRILVVSHCYKEKDETIRIISARKATRHEQQQYEGFRNES